MITNKKYININDLEFYAMNYDFNSNELKPFNIFHSHRVMRSIATWVAGKAMKDADLISWCFSDLRGRCEYEMIVSPWPPKDEGFEEKVDVFTMYIKPNQNLLIEMINKVSVSSAKNWLKEDNKRRKGTK